MMRCCSRGDSIAKLPAMLAVFSPAKPELADAGVPGVQGVPGVDAEQSAEDRTEADIGVARAVVKARRRCRCVAKRRGRRAAHRGDRRAGIGDGRIGVDGCGIPASGGSRQGLRSHCQRWRLTLALAAGEEVPPRPTPAPPVAPPAEAPAPAPIAAVDDPPTPRRRSRRRQMHRHRRRHHRYRLLRSHRRLRHPRRPAPMRSDADPSNTATARSAMLILPSKQPNRTSHTSLDCPSAHQVEL